jgi:beta-N-acetylhexosaminidase
VDQLARLTPSDRAGQVLMIGVPVGRAGTAWSSVRTYRPGGVFLQGRSAGNPAEIGRQIRRLQQVAGSGKHVPLHVAVDQEGGRVQTLSGPGIGRLPSAVDQGRWDDATLVTRTARWAAELHTIGVTMNFAPVADTVPADGRRNPPIGAIGRQYGSRPDDVAADVATVTRALQDAGVVATLKHFPGLGRVRVNTDFSAAATDPATTPGDSHLRPFAAGVDAGAGAVMMSSAHYPKLDARRPAMFSPRVVTLLRTQLGFTGLVVSDDLGAARSVAGVPVGRRAVAFVAAGGDMVLTVRASDAGPMGAALVEAAKKSPVFRRRLDEAALHVLLSKQRAGLLHC